MDKIKKALEDYRVEIKVKDLILDFKTSNKYSAKNLKMKALT
jgi:hypothetical protein